MKTRTVIGVVVMMFALVQASNAGSKDNIQKYLNDTACKVKATADPVEKREILHTSLQNMSQALEKIESTGMISQNDRAGVDRLKIALQSKQDELMGTNGYDRVADGQLDAFSDYVVQEMEQAGQYVTISLVSLLLIVLILILI
ncbi:MAG: hypothetical protein JXA42_06275 [Anaerolineales bacterium]|nr:hypothetical protein [Anaerolineales bacterium]